MLRSKLKSKGQDLKLSLALGRGVISANCEKLPDIPKRAKICENIAAALIGGN
jgi:hypothetical protein